MSHPIPKPNGARPTTVSNWTAFVDAWAQYHNVRMHEPARDALINACRNALGEANAPDAAPAHDDPRLVALHRPVPNRVQASVRAARAAGTDEYLAGITAKSDEPVQSIAKAPPRVIRRPPPPPGKAEAPAAPTVRRITRPAR